MRRRLRWTAGATAVVLAVVLENPVAAADPADRHGGSGDGSGITVIVQGLNGPRQISDRGRGHTLFVAESDSGQITEVDVRKGTATPLVTGLGANLLQGVDDVRNGFLVAIGSPEPAEDGTPPPPAPYGGAVLLGVVPGQTPMVRADLEKFERDNNPDGQTQFGPDGAPLDALSNPYFVRAHRDGSALIADAAGNDILFRTTKGVLTLWRTLPLVTDGVCADAEQPGQGVIGCDAVPTGIAYGNRDDVYVSAAGALAPGAGRVYVYDWRHPQPVRTITGLTAPTGVAVDRAGNVYVSELTYGFPEGEPPPGFDPATIGRIVKITPTGDRTYAQVTMPAGLLVHKGALYASAWSVAGTFFGIPDAGQIVRVDDSAFRDDAAPTS